MDWHGFWEALGIGSSAGIAIAFLGSWMVTSNRAKESPLNQTIEPPTPAEIAWKITHIRDDVGPMMMNQVITNTLLIAILAALLRRA